MTLEELRQRIDELDRQLVELLSERARAAQMLGKIGPVNVNAQALVANDFHLNGGQLETVRDYSLALDTPVHLGRTVLPAHAEVHYLDRNGTKAVDAAARLSANFRRFDLSTAVHYQKQLGTPGGIAKPSQTTVDFMGSGRIGDVRFRGVTTFDVTPSAHLRTAELEAYWSATENVDWDAGLAYEATAHRARARKRTEIAAAAAARAAMEREPRKGFRRRHPAVRFAAPGPARVRSGFGYRRIRR